MKKNILRLGIVVLVLFIGGVLCVGGKIKFPYRKIKLP